MCRYFRKIHFKSPRSTGFTLIELMIALFVFAIGMLAVTAMCLISIQGNSLVNRMTQANFLAQSKMEEMLSERNMSALVPGTYTEANIDGTGNAGGSYNRTAVITADANTRWLSVTVGWTDNRGTHQVALQSMARGS